MKRASKRVSIGRDRDVKKRPKICMELVHGYMYSVSGINLFGRSYKQRSGLKTVLSALQRLNILWTSVPYEIRSTENRNQCTSKLKIYVLRIAYL